MSRVRSNKNEIEDRVAYCVAEVVSASEFIRRDVGGVQMRDFDLVFSDGHCEPLEVTVHADEATVQTMDRLERHGGVIRANVKRVWLLSPPYFQVNAAGAHVAYDVWQCEREIVPIIEQLEHAGVTRFDAMQLMIGSGGRFSEFGRRLLELEIYDGLSYLPSRPDDEPRIELQAGGGGAVGPENVTQAVEEEASDAGNQVKLAACPDAPRRHLFVVVTLAGGMAWWALQNILEEKTKLPPAPVLPDAITTVWAGTPAGGIFVTPPEPWQLFRLRD